jgi:hypothetical protein
VVTSEDCSRLGFLLIDLFIARFIVGFNWPAPVKGRSSDGLHGARPIQWRFIGGDSRLSSQEMST